MYECMYVQGGSAPRSNPLSFYIPLFNPFVYLLLTNDTPFYIPCLELCIPNVTAVNALSFKWESVTNRTFSQLYKAIKFIC